MNHFGRTMKMVNDTTGIHGFGNEVEGNARDTPEQAPGTLGVRGKVNIMRFYMRLHATRSLAR
jgi:hypothetical protein